MSEKTYGGCDGPGGWPGRTLEYLEAHHDEEGLGDIVLSDLVLEIERLEGRVETARGHAQFQQDVAVRFELELDGMREQRDRFARALVEADDEVFHCCVADRRQALSYITPDVVREARAVCDKEGVAP